MVAEVEPLVVQEPLKMVEPEAVVEHMPIGYLRLLVWVQLRR